MGFLKLLYCKHEIKYLLRNQSSLLPLRDVMDQCFESEPPNIRCSFARIEPDWAAH